MKHTILKATIVMLLLFPAAIMAQKSSADVIFNQYSDHDGFTSVDITKGLFELFASIDADDPGFDEFQQAVKGLESLKLLAYSVTDSTGSVSEKNQFISDVHNKIPMKDFKELLIVKDKDSKINFYAKSDGRIIREMLMVVDGPDEAVLLSLYGDIDLNHVAKLGSSLDMGGMEYLSKIKSH